MAHEIGHTLDPDKTLYAFGSLEFWKSEARAFLNGAALPGASEDAKFLCQQDAEYCIREAESLGGTFP